MNKIKFPIVKPIEFLQETEGYELQDLMTSVFDFQINDSSSLNSDYFSKKVQEMIYSMLSYEEIFNDFINFQEYCKKNTNLKELLTILSDFFNFQKNCCFEIYFQIFQIKNFNDLISRYGNILDQVFLELKEKIFAGYRTCFTESNYEELLQKSLSNKQRIFEETKDKDETSFHYFLEILEKLDETVYAKWNRIKYKLFQLSNKKEILLKLGEN